MTLDTHLQLSGQLQTQLPGEQTQTPLMNKICGAVLIDLSKTFLLSLVNR